MSGFDPIRRSEQVSRLVCEGERRRYRRFRAARFYGGIATADCVGCSLRCLFCWSWPEVVHPEAVGELCSPADVARRLTSIARKKGFRQVRISGNEPTLCREHLLGVLAELPKDLLFILETNGILLGHDASYAEALSRFSNVSARVSLKGTSEEEFSRLTGASPDGFSLQLGALENLYRRGVRVHAAAMVSFSPQENVRALRRRLARIAPALADLEVEELVLYGDVEDRLRKAKLIPGTAHDPRKIPPEQV